MSGGFGYWYLRCIGFFALSDTIPSGCIWVSAAADFGADGVIER